MVNITRFNPVETALENFFRSAPAWLQNADWRAAEQPAQFRMDVSENDSEYQVLAELPGVTKDDISITIDGNEISVSAEVKQEKVVKERETVLRAERYFGKVQRAFTLGHEIDPASAQAKYTDGVLTLTLPKKIGAAAKKLPVH